MISIIALISAGCQKKAEQPEGEKANKDTTNMVSPEQPKPDTTAMADTTKKYPDLKGTWTGSFQSHGATLKITDQKDNNFKGTLYVSYREPLNKTISGTLKSGSNNFTMKDEVKSRYEASYAAKLSDDMKKITGTAHFKVDNNDVNFSFSRK